MTIKRVCAYCGAFLGNLVLPKGSNPEKLVTHGICPKCLIKEEEKFEKEISEQNTNT